MILFFSLAKPWLSAFLNAANVGDITSLKILLQSGKVDINEKGYETRATALIVATISQSFESVNFLLQNGADVNLRDMFGFTALHHAVYDRRIDLVKLIVEVGKANIEARDNFGTTAFIISSLKNSLEVMKFLFGNNADINAQSKVGFSALFFASKHGFLNIVKFLISIRADIEIKTKFNDTSLNAAAHNGHFDIVKILVETGKTNIHERAVDGNTALLSAAKKGHLTIVEYLHKRGADINTQAYDRRSPLLAASLSTYASVVNYLLKNGANVESKTNLGFTSLHAAAQEGNEENVKLLVEKGNANVNAKSDTGITPILWSANFGRLRIIKYLESQSAYIEAKDNDGRTMIWFA